MFVPDCRPWYAKVCWPADFHRKELKQMRVRGETKLLGKNVNLENVGKVLRTNATDRRETDGREFIVDSLMDWKPVR